MITARYGSWRSPVSASLLGRDIVAIGETAFDDGDLWWCELRPDDAGRHVLRRLRDGQTMTITPEGYDVRTGVHEYGGGAWRVARGAAYFANAEDQRIYRQVPGSAPVAVTPEASDGGHAPRYADFEFTADGRGLICVREARDDRGVTNELVLVPLTGGAPPAVLRSGSDFCASPCLSPDGRRLAWLEWNHPDMPWDSTTLYVAPFRRDGTLGTPVKVAGGENESVAHPRWSADGALCFVGDRSDWWNLYRWDGNQTACVCPMEAECGMPLWLLGMSTYVILSDGRIVCRWSRGSVQELGVIDPRSRRAVPLPLPFTSYGCDLSSDGRRVAVTAGGPRQAQRLLIVDPDTGRADVVTQSQQDLVSPEFISLPRPVDFPNDSGGESHAVYYPPANPGFTAGPGELPPLIVMSHGGPTAQASQALNLDIQLFTSRGFAVVDVDYRGSTGYGRRYRNLLRGWWGLRDVADCIGAAEYLVAEGLADPDRIGIRGGSASGFTVLCALTFSDYFDAGVCYYGIGDPERLAADTHKFESHYIDGLIAPLPGGAGVYRQRSPARHVDKLATPVMLLHGLKDKVVPPSQSFAMAEALDGKGIPHALVTFEDEAHGFCRADNIIRAAEAELYFFSRIFGIRLADAIKPVDIAHLSPPRAP